MGKHRFKKSVEEREKKRVELKKKKLTRTQLLKASYREVIRWKRRKLFWELVPNDNPITIKQIEDRIRLLSEKKEKLEGEIRSAPEQLRKAKSALSSAELSYSALKSRQDEAKKKLMIMAEKLSILLESSDLTTLTLTPAQLKLLESLQGKKKND